MKEPLSVKVTKIKDCWNCRLYRNGEIFDELRCKHKSDIRLCILYMLRWYDKLGVTPISKMAMSSRDRIAKQESQETKGSIERVLPTYRNMGKLTL